MLCSIAFKPAFASSTERTDKCLLFWCLQGLPPARRRGVRGAHLHAQDETNGRGGARGTGTAATHNSTESEKLKLAWDKFFAVLESKLASALDDGWLSLDDVESMAPHVIIGLPSVTIFEVLHHSATIAPERPKNSSWFSWLVPAPEKLYWPGAVSADMGCDHTTRPKGGVADWFWPRLIALKRSLERNALPLSAEELLYLRCKLCTGGEGESREAECSATAILEAGGGARQRLLHCLCAEFMHLAIDMSKLAAFKERSAALLKRTVYARQTAARTAMLKKQLEEATANTSKMVGKVKEGMGAMGQLASAAAGWLHGKPKPARRDNDGMVQAL